MNKVIGTVETKQIGVIQGDHHIIVTLPLADGQDAIPAGCCLYEDGGFYKALSASDEDHTPSAVSLDEAAGKTSSAAVSACVHGLVRTEDLCYADGSAVKAAVAVSLRRAGIYCTGTPAPAGE